MAVKRGSSFKTSKPLTRLDCVHCSKWKRWLLLILEQLKTFCTKGRILSLAQNNRGNIRPNSQKTVEKHVTTKFINLRRRRVRSLFSSQKTSSWFPPFIDRNYSIKSRNHHFNRSYLRRQVQIRIWRAMPSDLLVSIYDRFWARFSRVNPNGKLKSTTLSLWSRSIFWRFSILIKSLYRTTLRTWHWKWTMFLR